MKHLSRITLLAGVAVISLPSGARAAQGETSSQAASTNQTAFAPQTLATEQQNQKNSDSASDVRGVAGSGGGLEITDGSDGAIIVTANKRQERLSDVGLTINVATGEQMAAKGVADASQLVKVVPGLSVSNNANGYAVYSIRGVNFNSLSASTPPAVSMYLDQAPLPYSVMTGGLLLDVSRVEILKGPQGTLFGQNSTAGAINVIPAKPTGYLSYGINSEVNHFGQVMHSGFVSGPVTDTLRARFAASTKQFGAWQKGYYLNNQKNGDSNELAGRLILEWTPDEKLTVNVMAIGYRDRSEGQQPQGVFINPLFPVAAPPGLLEYNQNIPNSNRDADIDVGFDTRKRVNQAQAVLKVDYDVSDEVKLTSITNYASVSSLMHINADGTAIAQIFIHPSSRIKTFSEEFRISGDLSAIGVVYNVGANYQKDTIPRDNILQEFPGFSGFTPGASVESQFALTSRNYAAFGNADLKISRNLTLTGGLRYTDTRQSINGCNYDGGNGLYSAAIGGLSSLLQNTDPDPIGPGGCSILDNSEPNPSFLPKVIDRAASYTNVSWRGGINYKINADSLLYGLVSRGYKSGQYSSTSVIFSSQIADVKPEELTSYEIGAKTSFFGSKVQLNISGFYYDYKDKQFLTYVNTVFAVTPTVRNVPKARVQGIDFDVTLRPIPGLTVTAAGTYIDTKLGAFSGLDFQGTPTDFGGKEFDFAPPYSATADAEYEASVGPRLKGYIGGNLVYHDRTFADLGEPTTFRINAYTVFDARVGLRSEAGWTMGLFARNLTNKYYWTSVNSGGDEATRFAGVPRTFGITLGFRN